MILQRAFRMTLVVVVTVAATRSTASAQMYGNAWPQNIRISFCNSGVPHGYWGGQSPGQNRYSCGMATSCQPRACRSGYLNTPGEIEQYFQRKLANIKYRYMIKPALIRARLERQREIAAIKSEYADAIESNRQRIEVSARRSAPQRLSPSQYHPTTGVISWPRLLQENAWFARDRERLDLLFAQRARSNGSLVSGNSGEIRNAIERMKDTLAGMAREGEVDGTTYMGAKNFLKSLTYEAQFAARTSVVSVAATHPCAVGPRDTALRRTFQEVHLSTH